MAAHGGDAGAVVKPATAVHPLDRPWTLGRLNSFVQVSWIWPLLRLGRSKPLEEGDIWPVPRGMSIRAIGDLADELWRAERLEAAVREREPRLLRGVLWKIAGRHLVGFWSSSVGVAIFFTIVPLLLRSFLVALQEGAGAAELAAYGGPFVVCWYAITFFVTTGKWQAVTGGCKCRLAIQRLLYSACLAAPVDSLSSGMSPENLMSVDAERFFTAWQLLFPHCFILLGTFGVLLFLQLGIVPTAIGMSLLYVTAYGQKRIGGVITRYRKRAMEEADHRLQLTQQFLDGIRVLKMSGWTGSAERRLAAVRTRELRHLCRVHCYKGANTTLGLASPCLTGFLVFSVYALLGGRMATDVVFPALTVLRGLALYMVMLPAIFSSIGEFFAAYGRVLAFLKAQPVGSPVDRAARPTAGDGAAVSLRGARFFRCGGAAAAGSQSQGARRGGVQPEAASSAAEARAAFSLGPVDLELGPEDLCIVCGPVGSGKSSLLLGMLGELQREGRAGLSGRISLCGQEPWIRSATLRENVRCLRPWDEAAYGAAIASAQLKPDLAVLPAGDETEIGTRGINISGGQKARVALARTLFGVASCNVVLLDDVLSAVDVHVARHIINHALLGILRGRARVLVANTFLPLLLPHASQVVVLAPGGVVDAVGPPEVALASSEWLRKAVDAMGGVDLTTGGIVLTEEPCERPGAATPSAGAAGAEPDAATPTKADGSLLVAEDRVIGVLDSRAYGAFFKEASSRRTVRAGLLQFAVVVALVALTEGSRSATDVWITAWTSSAESTESTDGGGLGKWFWISGFAAILVMLALFGTLRVAIFTRAIVAIGGRTHERMMRKVLGASVPLFFDVVPTGRILNRFSKDLDSLDAQLPEFMFDFMQSAAYVLAAVLLSVATSYVTALASVPLFFGFVHVRRFFAATSRELKRLEGVSRSPLYTHFAETLSGLVHVRAMDLAGSMLEQFEAKIDANSAFFLHQEALLPWLIHRVNMLSAHLMLIIVTVAIVFRHSMDPALVGLSLASGAGLLGRLHQCVQTSIQTENHFTSVERLEHFDSIAQEEPPADEEPKQPAAAWPQHGEVVFEDVQLRYRPHLPLVLCGVSFKVLPGQRAGLIGRTGSGKSTCMLAILRMVGLDGGQVRIDGCDVARVPLARLRGRAVAIIPQEPYLFEGSVRENLDPSGTAGRAECEGALRSTQLLGVVTAMGGLDAAVANHGANLSLGQRQLLCIARAMLRRARVVLLDEASANIDATTDVLIQESIRTCFGSSTLLIIAHRLSTIADADLIVCLDRGRVVEAGQPDELRRRRGAVAAMFGDTLAPRGGAFGCGPRSHTPQCWGRWRRA